MQGQDLAVPPGRRITIPVHEVVSKGEDVAMRITSPRGIIAERATCFFCYGAWDGGHDALRRTL